MYNLSQKTNFLTQKLIKSAENYHTREIYIEASKNTLEVEE